MRQPSLSPVYTPARVLTISTDADYEYYRAFGSRTLAQIQAVLNAAEIIYAEQVGVQFSVKHQHVFTSIDQPYTRRDSMDLLFQFQTYVNQAHHLGAADVYHLFTGKNMLDGVIGLAFVGTICTADNRFSFSLSKNVNGGIHPLVTAHELGHNFGARHPEEVIPGPLPTPSLMTGLVEAGNTRFSEFSLGEIASHIDQNGSCLDEAYPRVTLRASLRRSRRFRARVTAHDITGRSCLTRLYVAPRRTYLKEDFSQAVIAFEKDTGSDKDLVSANDTTGTTVQLHANSGRSTKRRVRLFLRAVLDCGGTQHVSSVKRLRIPRERRGRGVSLRRWVHRLSQRLKER